MADLVGDTPPTTGPRNVLLDVVETPGPWQHRHVAANGARFHVVGTGPGNGPLVVLLHGFPEFWWCWRDQLEPLAHAGFRAVAMDLRGYGGSDKTPDGYDPVTLAQDVSGVVKALGARDAVLVGHGWGGYVGWAVAALHPRQVSALCAVAAPHPLAMLSSLGRGSSVAVRHLLAMQVPMWPERRLARGRFLAEHLRSWSAPGSAFPTDADVATYQRAMGNWPAPHCALEYHRWLVRSRVRQDGRRFGRAMRTRLGQPVLCVTGDEDRVVAASAIDRSRRWTGAELVHQRMPGVGHFPHEEDPARFTELLMDWLGALD